MALPDTPQSPNPKDAEKERTTQDQQKLEEAQKEAAEEREEEGGYQ